MTNLDEILTTILRLLYAIADRNRALDAMDWDDEISEVAEAVYRQIGLDPSLIDAPSAAEQRKTSLECLQSALQAAEFAIRPIQQDLARVHGTLLVEESGKTAKSWSHWAVKFAPFVMWTFTPGRETPPTSRPFDLDRVRTGLEVEYDRLRQIYESSDSLPGKESETQTHTPKQTKKKPQRHKWDGDALNAANAFKKARDDGSLETLKDFCESYVAEKKPNVAARTLESKLSYFRDKWDPDRKYGRPNTAIRERR